MLLSLFSFKGTMGRLPYWFTFCATVALSKLTAQMDISQLSPLAKYALFAGVFLWVWIVLAVQIKRLHDLGRSGWWWLLNLVPFGAIVMFIWLGFFPGTDNSDFD